LQEKTIKKEIEKTFSLSLPDNSPGKKDVSKPEVFFPAWIQVKNKEDFEALCQRSKGFESFAQNASARIYARKFGFRIAKDNPVYYVEQAMRTILKDIEMDRSLNETEKWNTAESMLKKFYGEVVNEAVESEELSKGISSVDMEAIAELAKSELLRSSQRLSDEQARTSGKNNPAERESVFAKVKEKYFKQKADEEKEKNSFVGRIKSWFGR